MMDKFSFWDSESKPKVSALLLDNLELVLEDVDIGLHRAGTHCESEIIKIGNGQPLRYSGIYYYYYNISLCLWSQRP